MHAQCSSGMVRSTAKHSLYRESRTEGAPYACRVGGALEMIHMRTMVKSTGKSAKMGTWPMRGRGTLTWRRYCEKKMSARIVGSPICMHDPTPLAASPHPASHMRVGARHIHT
jgi:hypothetical protein